MQRLRRAADELSITWSPTIAASWPRDRLELAERLIYHLGGRELAKGKPIRTLKYFEDAVSSGQEPPPGDLEMRFLVVREIDRIPRPLEIDAELRRLAESTSSPDLLAGVLVGLGQR